MSYYLIKLKIRNFSILQTKFNLEQGIVQEATLKGHSHHISCLLKLSKTIIVSGSYDISIKIWDVITGNCLKTLEGHVSSVLRLLKINEGQFLSCCYCIKLWDSKSGICLKTLEWHNSWINYLILINQSSQIVSASSDTTIKI